MKKLVTTTAVVLAAALLGPQTALAQEPMPTAREIMDRVIERVKRLERPELAARYVFEQKSVYERLNSDGTVKEREERLLRAVRIRDRIYLRLVERNGRPLAGKDLERERAREQKFRSELSNPKSGPRPEEQLDFNRELVERYRAEVLGREQMNGRSAYVLRFEPKSKDLPVRRNVDRLLNKLTGKLWVDAEEYQIIRVEGKLTDSVRIALGILASFQRLDFVLEQTRLDGTTWMPSRLETFLVGRVFFSSIRQKSSTRWENFQKTAGSGE